MASVATLLPTRGQPMAKDSKRASGAGEGPGTRQVNFKAGAELFGDLERIAEAFNLDVSSVIRMILRENLRPYMRRADAILDGAGQEDQE